MTRIALYASLMTYSGCVVVVHEPTTPGTINVDIDTSTMTPTPTSTIDIEVPEPIVITQPTSSTCHIPDLPVTLTTPTLPPRQEVILTTPMEVENFLISHIEQLMDFIDTRTQQFIKYREEVIVACQ